VKSRKAGLMTAAAR